MKAVFLLILNNSIATVPVILLVLLMHFFLKKIPKKFMLLIWAVAAIRLIVPFPSISVDSMMNVNSESEKKTEIIFQETEEKQTNDIFQNEVTATDSISEDVEKNYSSKPITQTNEVHKAENSQVNTVISDKSFEMQTAEQSDVQEVSGEFKAEINSNILWNLSVVWILGIAAVIIYVVVSCVRLRIRLRGSKRLNDNVFRCNNIDSPFVIGVLRPLIYLPSTLAETDVKSVLLHENAHIRHCDHIIKLAAFVLLMVYWFDPFIWLSYIIFGRDLELACDERVIKKCGSGIKKEYSTALINCSVPRELNGFSTLAFGEKAVKERVINVLGYKKPTFLTMVIGFTASALVLAACVVSDQVTVSETESVADTEASEVISVQDEEFEQLLKDVYKMVPSEELHVKGESFENITKDIIYDAFDLMYDVIYGDLSADEINEQKDRICVAIDAHPYLEENFKTELRKNFLSGIEYYTFTPEQTKGLSNEEITQMKEKMIEKRMEEQGHGGYFGYVSTRKPSMQRNEMHKRYVVFSELSPHRSIWEWFSFEAFFTSDQMHATLENVMDCIEKAGSEGENEEDVFDYLISLLVEYTFDYGFSGSGAYGYRNMILKGKDEWVTLSGDIVYHRYDAETDKIYSQFLYRQINTIYPELNDDEFLMYYSGKKYSKIPHIDKNKKAPDELTVSDGTLKRVKYIPKNILKNLIKEVKKYFPDITQEQLDRYILFKDAIYSSGESYPYLESVIVGETDPSIPKLTLKKMKQIIKESKENPNVRPKIKHYDDELHDESYVGHYIMMELDKAQYYCDVYTLKENVYYLDGNTENTRTEEIVVDKSGAKVTYNKYSENGEKIKSEVLFDVGYTDNV